MATEAEETLAHRPSIARLWLGFLAGPVAWVLHLGASYAAVPYVCGTKLGPILHAFTALALALSITGFVSSLRCWRAAGKPSHARGGGMEGRTSLLSIGGMAMSLFFSFVIVVQSTPNYFVESTVGLFADRCE